ncbi:hypothetical protein PVAND_005299 [Polypedilum vanderplanki]|uniref:Lipase domain-containing protein n=1 Tax=Polypedilum vanderplanki TaxID=319348 RepID=A0A9J6BZZ7_POLVA|nr:hypothetical protein PVAND_005299 [Polypedilum vanderplanki]
MNSFIYFSVLLAFVNSASAGCMDNVNLKFFGSSYTDFQSVSMPEPINVLSYITFWSIPSLPSSTQYYDPNKKTVIYVHGLFEGTDTVGPKAMIEGYLQRKSEYNVILYDYSSCGEKFLTFTTHQVDLLEGSNALAKMNFDFTKVHIIGYGYGTFIAANVGRKLNGNLRRITGLEPAGILDNILGPLGYAQLNKDNAQFVDVIHTDTGFLGDKKSLGHVDFWVNGGWHQPSCLQSVFDINEFLQNSTLVIAVVCNDARSWMYYAESVNSPASPLPFQSLKCATNYATATENSYTASNCNGSPIVSMGYYADLSKNDLIQSTSNNYFVATNGASKFSLT